MSSEKVYSTIAKVTPIYDFALSITGYKRSVEYFVSQLPFAGNEFIKILDAGCGIGLYSLALLKKYKTAQISAFDFNRRLAERLKEKVIENKFENRVHLFTADIQNSLMEIQNEKFDLIITAGVLEYVPLEKTVKNLSHFLKPNGYFFNSPVRDTIWGNIVGRLYACRPYSRTKNIQAFEHNGFTLEKIIKLPWYLLASFKEAHIFKKNKI